MGTCVDLYKITKRPHQALQRLLFGWLSTLASAMLLSEYLGTHERPSINNYLQLLSSFRACFTLQTKSPQPNQHSVTVPVIFPTPLLRVQLDERIDAHDGDASLDGALQLAHLAHAGLQHAGLDLVRELAIA